MENTLTEEKKSGLSAGENANNSLGTLHPAADLRTRVVRSGFWVFALRITDRLCRLARTIVLARILAPADFGLFGIALLAMSALETFSQTGFNAALIQKKEDTKSYLDTAWTVQAIRGILLALIAFAIAPYVAAFFDAPAAKPILQVIAFSVLLGGFSNIGVMYFQKELEFRKLFVLSLSSTLADIGVAITAAVLLRSVWALVFGLLASTLVRTVVSYLIHPYRPRLAFSKQQFKELFGFGKWILGSSILIFLLTHGDDALVGKVLGVSALGFYQLAYRLSNMPATEITHVISQVTFPAYSKLQDNLPRLREAYLKVLQITAFLSFLIAGLIFVLAPEFTQIFLGEKWMPMVPAMQVLCILGGLRSIVATMGPVFYSTGNPKIGTQLSIMQLLIMVTLIYPLTMKWGIVGTSLVVVLTNLASSWGLKKTLDLIKCKLTTFCQKLLYPLLGSSIMYVLLQFTKNMVDVNWANLSLLVIFGIAVYLLTIYLLDTKIYSCGLIENIGSLKKTLSTK